MPSKKKPSTKKSHTKKSKKVILKKTSGKSGKARKTQPAAKATSASKPAPKKMLLQSTNLGSAGTAVAPPSLTAVYQVSPKYQGPDGAVTTVPFLLPPTMISGSTNSWGKAIEVDVSYVYGQKVASGGSSCTISGSDFTLSWIPGAGGFIAQVFIPAYAWNAAASYRAQLSNAFSAFCQSLETLEANQCLMRGGSQGIAQRVVEALPVPLNEVLYYKYGFNAASGYVDLQPGMRLRIEFETFEFTVPNSPLNGFVGGGVGYYDVCGYLDPNGNQRIAFDAFLGAIRPPNLTSPTMVAGGIIDLQGATTARRYYRLFYPANLSSSSQGNTSTANNVMLIGANTLADLATATTAYLQNQTCAPGGSSVLCNLFRGRAIVVPEILIYLASQTLNVSSTSAPPTTAVPTYVPIGTTVRNLVERRFNWIFTPTTTELKLQMARQYRQISTVAPPAAPANYNTVQFNMYAPPPSLPGPDVYDLPLVKGDVLGFTNR